MNINAVLVVYLMLGLFVIGIFLIGAKSSK